MVRFCFIFCIIFMSSSLSKVDEMKTKKSFAIDSTSVSIEVEIDKNTVWQNDSIRFTVYFINTSDSLLVIPVGGHTLHLQSANSGFGGLSIIIDELMISRYVEILPMKTKVFFFKIPASKFYKARRSYYYITYSSAVPQKEVRYFASTAEFPITVLME